MVMTEDDFHMDQKKFDIARKLIKSALNFHPKIFHKLKFLHRTNVAQCGIKWSNCRWWHGDETLWELFRFILFVLKKYASLKVSGSSRFSSGGVRELTLH